MPFRASPSGAAATSGSPSTRPRPDGPREIAFRRRRPSDAGNTVTETVARLDLRDPANLAIARPLFESQQPLAAVGGAGKQAVLDRIATHGVVERTVSEVDDDSPARPSGSAAAGSSGSAARRSRSTSGSSGRRVQRGALAGARLDCVK